MTALFGVFNQALMITGFVFVMMLVIEYVNILTSGTWQQKLSASRWGQYFFAALMGATPGCLGAFIVVAMYSHRMLTIGAVVTAMIATSGDESFVMLALIPKQAILLTFLLLLIGIVAGFVTDTLSRQHKTRQEEKCEGFEVHGFESCRCFPRGEILKQWKHFSPFRTTLTTVLTLFILVVATGQVGPSEWNWIRISILLVTALALFIVITVPDHFLEEHLWDHVARKHVPRIFLWVFGTLLLMHFLIERLDLEGIIQANLWVVMIVATLVGLIPESGPHLIFVTLFAKGAIPFSILLASSIVQDGHGMLPVIAYSRHSFFVIKLINLLVGIIFGALALAFGF
jgi:hypothetical protein